MVVLLASSVTLGWLELEGLAEVLFESSVMLGWLELEGLAVVLSVPPESI